MGKFLLPENFIMMPIPADRYYDVCGLLGGSAPAGLVAVPTGNAQSAVAAPATVAASEPSDNTGSSEPVGSGSTATTAVSPSDDSGEIDAHGHPWSADLHASTKTKTKDGLWRMKVGVTRPDPLPGFPKEDASEATGTQPATDTPSATSQTAPEQASAPADTSPAEDDEFAAFRAAAAASDAADTAAAASVPARQYSDADLGALCNQAAVKLGDPNPVKEIIARFVPEGQVAHSRNIPTERRAEFVAAVEEKAGVTFAG